MIPPVRDDLPTGTVTFLFTDVEGSTRLLHTLGAEDYADALAEHRRVIREACAAEHGVEVMLRNPIGFGPSATPGAGLGLVGLTERAELSGGRLEHGANGSTFVLHGWIPLAP